MHRFRQVGAGTMRLKTAETRSGDSYAEHAICAAFAEFGVSPARLDEIEEARGFAARLIGGEMASAETLAWMHQRTGAALFLARDGGELTGLLAFILLSEEGVRAVWADTFEALQPDPAHVAGPGAPPAGIYNWGVATSRFGAVKRLFGAFELMRRQAVPHLAFFGRPSTKAGWRVTVDHLKFKPLPGSKTGLVWIEPVNQFAGVAA